MTMSRRERNLVAVKAYRKRKTTESTRATRVDGPIWTILARTGYTNRKSPKRPNNLGLYYEGP